MTQKDPKGSPAGLKIQLWAEELLDRARLGSDASDLIEQLAGLHEEDLRLALPDDDHKKAFWINLYNAFNLMAMKAEPSISEARTRRLKHFFRKGIVVAGRRLNLIEIENDLLRRGRLWWSQGYVRRPFPAAFHRQYRVDVLDPRIHFALNCGAMSCPPIRFYRVGELDAQLEMATAGFLQTEVQRKTGLGEEHLFVSSVFRMYQGDFGGRNGIRDWVRKYRPDVGGGPIRLHWLRWDWTSELDAFV